LSAIKRKDKNTAQRFNELSIQIQKKNLRSGAITDNSLPGESKKKAIPKNRDGVRAILCNLGIALVL